MAGYVLHYTAASWRSTVMFVLYSTAARWRCTLIRPGECSSPLLPTNKRAAANYRTVQKCSSAEVHCTVLYCTVEVHCTALYCTVL